MSTKNTNPDYRYLFDFIHQNEVNMAKELQQPVLKSSGEQIIVYD